MQVSEEFKRTINTHLQSLGAADLLFAETLKKPNKTIDECCNYILTTVKNSGKSGFADEEIYGMAKHYYDEDSITAKGAPNVKVVVNHSVGKASPKNQASAPAATKTVTVKKPTKQAIVNQPSLF